MTCIHCGSRGPLSQEHSLPRALGTFKDSPFFSDRICSKCNSKIGRLEEQFGRSGPEAFFRQFLGIKGRNQKVPVNPFVRGSVGAPPIDFLARLPEDESVVILWEINPDDRTVREVTQAVFIDERGQCHQIRIPKWMTSTEQLRQKMDEAKLKGKFDVSCFARDDEMERVRQIVSGLGGSNFHWRNKPQDGAQIVNPIAKVSVTGLYFRAIAKVAFHYALTSAQPLLTGHEKYFDDIKEFIMNGGVEEKFYKEVSSQIVTLPENHRPASWGHVLVVEPTENFLQVRMQFFLGPSFDPPVHIVRLSSQAIPSVKRIGHFYMYYESGPHDGYDGEVTELIVYKK